MNRISILLCAVIFLLSNSICAEDAFKSRVVELVPKLSVEKEADRLEPQKELEKLEFAASIPGKEAERTAYCAAVAEALSKDLPVPGKIWLLRSLERVGREESVATEAKLMGDADENVRDAAIRALASNSSRESTMILAQALAKSTDAKTRAALINALGFKRVPDAEKLFAKDVTHADENVRVAARSALARIGHRADAGPMADAAKLIDMGRAGQPGDVAALLAALDSPNIKTRQAAVQAVNLNKSPEMTSGITEKLKSAPVEIKPALLAVLGQRVDKSATQAVTEELKNSADPVRIGAAKALSKFGSGASVAPLMSLIGNSSDNVQRAVRDALDTIPGADVDQALIGFLSNASSGIRAEAAQRLGARGAASAGPALVGLLKDADAKVASEALKALAAVGGQDELTATLALLKKSENDAERDQAAKTSLAIVKRDARLDTRASVIIAALKESPEPAQIAILNILAQIGGSNALEAVREAVKNPSEKIQDGAVRALANWVDAAPLNDVASIANSTTNETHRVLSLRGYFRYAALPSQRSSKETTALFLSGLKAAKKADDKKMALAGLADIEDIDAFKQCVALLDEPAVIEEAGAAAVKSARFFTKSHPSEVAAAMQTVMDKSKNAATKKSAAEIKNKSGK